MWPPGLQTCRGSRKGYPKAPLATALGLVGTREEGKDALIHPTEHRHRGDVAAAFEELDQGEVGENLFCPREDSAGGEERVLLGGEHRNRPPEAPELPDGGAEGGVLGLRIQGPHSAQQALLRRPEAVEEHGGADLDENPQKGARGYACGGDERRPTDALGGYSHGPDRYGRSVGDAHERRTLQAEAVEDVL